MKSVLASFIEGAEGQESAAGAGAGVSASGSGAGVSGKAAKEGKEGTGEGRELGELLLAGCNDWENTTAKAPNGLEGLHRIDLGSKVYICVLHMCVTYVCYICVIHMCVTCVPYVLHMCTYVCAGVCAGVYAGVCADVWCVTYAPVRGLRCTIHSIYIEMYT
ncbi:hypothetical protein B484DRAFT_256073 [Ochromonadaceae sp. CCMP2298]|nr:hypothetical protein B484DRAFT_256073 [Ochromonadaceae sp. CCMP2298]